MKKVSWKEIVEFVGIAAIVGSLLFVGLQLKQSQEIAIASQYQSRYSTYSDYLSNVLQSEPAMRVHGKRALTRLLKSSVVPDSVKKWASDQPDDELAFWMLESLRGNKAYDNIYYQFEAGFVSENAWDGFRGELKRDLSVRNAGLRHVFLMYPETWRQSYQEMMYEVIAEIDSESD